MSTSILINALLSELCFLWSALVHHLVDLFKTKSYWSMLSQGFLWLMACLYVNYFEVSSEFVLSIWWKSPFILYVVGRYILEWIFLGTSEIIMCRCTYNVILRSLHCSLQLFSYCIIAGKLMANCIVLDSSILIGYFG